ncbi:MAG: hypothetical protein FJZ38_25410 [Candidatus Rokubacteria bacterium]|nr:hypothetical protein [Candidatus Rokubacteria bacterium]
MRTGRTPVDAPVHAGHAARFLHLLDGHAPADDARAARTTFPVNVDFFSAVVYDALEVPPDFCTSIFAVGRVAGWVAHVLEQFADSRLIRPRAEWIGAAPRALSTVGGALSAGR